MLQPGTRSANVISYGSFAHSNDSATMRWRGQVVTRRSAIEAQADVSSASVTAPQPTTSASVPF